MAHRLTSLNRTGARGIPFFMVRIDRAGIVSKRFDGEAYPFARYGGTCPRWDVHAADAPDIVLPQLIETLDERRFLTLAIALPRADGARGRQVIALGCEAKHARRIIHADGDGTGREIVRALEQGQALVECFRDDGGDCVLTPRCRLKQRLATAREAFMRELDKTTLAECAYPASPKRSPTPRAA